MITSLLPSRKPPLLHFALERRFIHPKFFVARLGLLHPQPLALAPRKPRLPVREGGLKGRPRQGVGELLQRLARVALLRQRGHQKRGLLRDGGLGFHRRISTGISHPGSISRSHSANLKLNSAHACLKLGVFQRRFCQFEIRQNPGQRQILIHTTAPTITPHKINQVI